MQLSSPQVCGRHCIASCAQPWNDKNGNNYVYLNLIGARKFLRGSSTGPSFVPEVTRPFTLFLGWGLGTRLSTAPPLLLPLLRPCRGSISATLSRQFTSSEMRYSVLGCMVVSCPDSPTKNRERVWTNVCRARVAQEFITSCNY